MSVKITHRRKLNSRKRWIRISARYINGVTQDLAQFTHTGDATLYIKTLRDAPCNTVEEIFID